MNRLPRLSVIVLLAVSACVACRRPTDLPPDFDARVAAPESVRSGRELFLSNCALCHGERGNGQGVRASAFTTPPRDFTNEAWRGSTSPRRVFRAVRDGLPGTPMPAWRHLGDDALVDLTAYLLSIGRSGRPVGE
jgi:mono/diheme cytochrome c family protein